MAERYYKVLSRAPVLGYKQGEVFSADLPDAQRKRMEARHSIEVTEKPKPPVETPEEPVEDSEEQSGETVVENLGGATPPGDGGSKLGTTTHVVPLVGRK